MDQLDFGFQPRRSPLIPALSLHGPYAWAVMAGLKPVENRTWTTRYRGPLAIHAGRSRRSDATARALLAELGLSHLAPQDWPRGVLLGTVTLSAVGPADSPEPRLAALGQSPWATGPVLWALEQPRLLATPLPCRGQQGMFWVDPTGWEFAD